MFQPAPFRSSSTILHQVVLGQPLYLLPSGVHPSATAQSAVLVILFFIFFVCPNQFVESDNFFISFDD
jgi:hypothetical protein